MENFIRDAGRILDRRTFFRGLGKWGMGAAAVAGVLMLPKKAGAQTNCVPGDPTNPCFCGNQGGSCANKQEFDLCGHNLTKQCAYDPSNNNCHCR